MAFLERILATVKTEGIAPRNGSHNLATVQILTHHYYI